MKKLIEKIRYRILFLSALILFNGCSLSEDEKYFIKKVDKLLEQNSTVKTDFKNLVDFEWKRVCFEYLTPTITFYYSFKGIKKTLKLPEDKFYINEGYVKGSPSKMCFNREQIFILSSENIKGSKNVLIQYKEGD